MLESAKHRAGRPSSAAQQEGTRGDETRFLVPSAQSDYLPALVSIEINQCGKLSVQHDIQLYSLTLLCVCAYVEKNR